MSFADVAVRVMDKLGYDHMARTRKSQEIYDAILLQVEAVAYELARTGPYNKVVAPTARMVPIYEAFVEEGMAKKTPAHKYLKGPAVPGFDFVYYRGPKMTGKTLHFVMQSEVAKEGARLHHDLRVFAPIGYYAALKAAERGTKSAGSKSTASKSTASKSSKRR